MAAVLELADVTVRRGAGHAAGRHRLVGGRGRALGDPRPQRRRQDHADPGLLARRSTRPRAWPGSSARCWAPSTSSSCARGSVSPASRSRSASRATSGSRDVVVSASYAVIGRWREHYDELDHDRAARPADRGRGRPPRRPHVRHAQRGRAQAGPDRAGTDDRPGAADPRRAGRRARPRRPRGPGLARCRRSRRTRARRPRSWSRHHVEEIPPGFTHAMLLRDGVPSSRRAGRRGDDRRDPLRDVRDAARARATRTAATRPDAPRAATGSEPATATGCRVVSAHGLDQRAPVGDLAARRGRSRRGRAGQPRPDLRHARGRLPRRHARGRCSACPARSRWCSRWAPRSALLAFLRPGLVKALHAGPDLQTGPAALIGHPVQVLTLLAPGQTGRVKIGGDEWTAAPYDEFDEIEPGERAEVVEIRGATAYVRRA